MSAPASDLKSFIESLKDRLPVSEVVGRKVQLKKNGREWIGLSPFSDEKTPSFTVNDQKRFWHCFSSGRSGDIISFLQETEKLEFMDALRQLAQQADMALPRFGSGEQGEKTAPLYAALEAAASWYISQLHDEKGEGAQAARDYIAQRGVSAEIRQLYRLGYAPSGGQALASAMRARGIEEKHLVEAGLLIKPDDGGRVYDRFRARFMFPIIDGQGRVIGFGGRDLSGTARAKYLNSPETPLFHKGRTLYGLPQARKAALEEGRVLLVEGYMDVIALAGAGIRPVVAGLGTAMTEHHLHALWRLAAEPIICLDGDAAGRRAGLRLIERALPELKAGHALCFALLPAGQDPDDVIQQGGAAALEEYLASALPLAEMIYTSHMEQALWDTPERKAACLAHLNDMAGRIGDAEVRRYYRQMFRTRLERQFWQADRAQGRHMPTPAASPPPVDGAKAVERILLGTLMAWPQLITIQQEQVQEIYFSDPDHAALRDELIRLVLENPQADVDMLYQSSTPRFQRLMAQIFGRSPEGALDGRRYDAAFPLARRLGDEDFAARCLAHFCRQQSLSALRQDLVEAQKEYAVRLDESSGGRFFSLARQAAELRAEIDEEAEALATEALEKTSDESSPVFDWGALFRHDSTSARG